MDPDNIPGQSKVPCVFVQGLQTSVCLRGQEPSDELGSDLGGNWQQETSYFTRIKTT